MFKAWTKQELDTWLYAYGVDPLAVDPKVKLVIRRWAIEHGRAVSSFVGRGPRMWRDSGLVVFLKQAARVTAYCYLGPSQFLEIHDRDLLRQVGKDIDGGIQDRTPVAYQFVGRLLILLLQKNLVSQEAQDAIGKRCRIDPVPGLTIKWRMHPTLRRLVDFIYLLPSE